MQRELEYTYAVYQTGSFSKAAKLLYASQPAVSMAVQRAEEGLGYPIFDRQAHPLRLTDAGRIFIHHVETIRESENLLHNEIDKLSDKKERTLRIGCSPLKASFLLPEIIARFHKQNPDVEVSLISSFRKGMIRDLQEHKVDIVINTVPETGVTDFNCIPAFEIHYLLCVPPDQPVNEQLRDYVLCGRDVAEGKHLLKQCPHVPISSFSGPPFVIFAEGEESYEQNKNIFSESNFCPNDAIMVTSPVMAYELAEKGIGATIVADYLIKEDSPLCFYHLRTQWERRCFYFILRKDYQLQKQQQLFIDLFREYMAERGQEENP